MERYNKLFQRLKSIKEGAFFPFVTLGDPNSILSLQIIDALVNNGSDAIEFGIPFSDPLADGHIIQKSIIRAFSAGLTLIHFLEMLVVVRQKHPYIPMGIMIYSNLVFHNGIDNFYQYCTKVGIDSLLLVDMPFEESILLIKYAIHYNIAQIFLCPPNAEDELLQKISYNGTGYTYLLSRSGVTGMEKRAPCPFYYFVNKLHAYHSAPILQGFGIVEKSQVRYSLLYGVAGAISGSAIVQIIDHTKNYKCIKTLKKFLIMMKFATRSY